MPASDAHATTFLDFVKDSPTSYHAVAAISARLRAAGFVEVDETERWSDALPANGFVRRDGALIAWRQPSDWTARTALRVVACHTDSPALKVKPVGEFSRAGFRLAETEIYGGPILATWFDRDLMIAGRLIDTEGRTHLVRTPAIARIPSLAVHLDASLRKDLSVDAQRDLNAVLGLEATGASGPAGSADSVIAVAAAQLGLDADDVLAEELFFVPAEEPALIGIHGELVASYRLDNLASVFPELIGFTQAEPTDHVQVLAAFDHEEIGSGTPSGASGPFLPQVLRRLSLAHGHDEDAHLAWVARGAALSADVAHGVHPVRSDRHDPVVQPRLGSGPVLKWSAPMRYATDAASTTYWVRACKSAGVEHQVFVNNNNVPGGRSLGPLLATRLGIRTVDAGVPVVGMHSARELCAASDLEGFALVTKGFLELD
ncbi:M18 family aminopeptidase [Propionimicrobium sp. PCR01-08-3]|uniref:M18 family aminopeptidase n=1 Tax=Propionimicrobium sp. PCR01-08-3 TaxID=3052086 RepID=UPI00255C3F85|nr:M18 family aminopeptidase [Propionimicrobium sp. PCR01-08-3]WIY81853.1 M18 family aminopeptidase [Propionimicrobium sp. PCR01-08-3]